MFAKSNLQEDLAAERLRHRKAEDQVLHETTRILNNDLYTEAKILSHLQEYNKLQEVISEEDMDPLLIYTPSEIKRMAIRYRLKFLSSKSYQGDIPYDAVIKIKELNQQHGKDLKTFKILALHDDFSGKHAPSASLIFTPTNHQNYYLLHAWGKPLSKTRVFRYWPLRNFETLATAVILITLGITLALPTPLISLDPKAEYWSGYRAATFFHILIFNLGVTAYITFTFAKNFSSSIWNREKDFD